MTEAAVHEPARQPGRVFASLLAACKRERPLLLAASPFIGVSFLVGPFLGWRRPVGIVFWYSQTVVMAAMVMVVLLVHRRLTRFRTIGPARDAYRIAWRELRSGPLTNDRLASLAVVAFVLPIVIACFTGWKVWLNGRLAFTWDVRLASWDRTLHGGRLPSDWLLPVLNVRWALQPIEALYDVGWAVFIHATLIWQALQSPSLRRTQFLVASALAWPLGGVVVAGLMMSAGPCYFGRVVDGLDPYGPLMDALRSGSQLAIPLQNYLWQLYRAGDVVTPGIGIAAMPSLHVITTALATAVLWHIGPKARLAGVASLVFVIAASVLLGWHYALDGYFGVVIAWLLWQGAAWFHRPAPKLGGEF